MLGLNILLVMFTVAGSSTGSDQPESFLSTRQRWAISAAGVPLSALATLMREDS